MTEYKNVMLISPNKIKNYGEVNINMDDSRLSSAIRISQNVHLVDIIKKDLVEHLQQLVYNKVMNLPDNIDDQDNVAYKTLLDDYVIPVLVYRTAVELTIINELKQRNMGVVKNSDTNVNQTSAADYKYLKNYYNTYFYDAVNKMIAFLCENKAAFVELDDDFCNCSSKPLYANTNLWLGK